MTDDEILQRLDRAIRRPRAAAFIASIANDLETDLRHHGSRLIRRAIPLCAYDALPDDIASSWVVALRADGASGAARYPNSIQRVLAYRGSGDMQLWSGWKWESRHLTSGVGSSVDRRWLTIPANVWHRPVMRGESWVVVAFHTAANDAVIEERLADDALPDAGIRLASP